MWSNADPVDSQTEGVYPGRDDSICSSDRMQFCRMSCVRRAGMIRIGVMDEEEGYVGKLAAYLNRVNKGTIQCCAFTEKDGLLAGLKEHRWDVLLSTDRAFIEGIQAEDNRVCGIWLTGQEHVSVDRIYCIYRFQSGASIAEELNRILHREGLHRSGNCKVIAVYSPVGRCGKTTMLLDHVRNQAGQQWLYIGMEDYGEVDKEPGDELLYYIKERRSERVIEKIEICDGIMASPFSPFDSKTINREDAVWLVEVLKQQTRYQGVWLDIGTGVLQQIEVLTVFDKVIVPYLSEAIALEKKEHFIELVKAYGLEEWLEQVYFLDMQDADRLSSIVESGGGI